MADEPMNVRGPCSSCGTPLATDQRYCVECGQRVGPPLALPYVPTVPGQEVPGGAKVFGIALPIPLQMVTTFAALALGFGVVIGTAISPNLAGIVASPAPPVVAQAPPAETPPATAGGGAGGGGPAPSALPATTIASSSPVGGGGGGGGGGKKKKKKKEGAVQPARFAGTVVRANPVAQSYTITSGGAPTSIHAGGLPQVGDKVEVPVRRLKNGTYAENGSRTGQGNADGASFSGTVTYCADLDDPSVVCDGSVPASGHYVYSVSGIGSSLLVRVPGSPPAAAPPQVGSVVDVSVRFDPFSALAPPIPPRADSGCTPDNGEAEGLPDPPVKPNARLVQTSATVKPSVENVDLEAVVQATCPDQVVLSADDVRESGRDLLPMAAGAGIDLNRLKPGDAVYATVGIGNDTGHTLTLKGITSDQGAAGADDPSQGQGTLTGL